MNSASQTVLFTQADAVPPLTGTEEAQLPCIKISSSLQFRSLTVLKARVDFFAQPASPCDKKDLQGSGILLGTEECRYLQHPAGLFGPTVLHPGISSAHIPANFSQPPLNPVLLLRMFPLSL